MQVNFDTYSYIVKVDSAVANRNNSVNDDVDSYINANVKIPVTGPSKAQIKSENIIQTQQDTELIKNSAEDETTFPTFNILSKYEKYFKVLNEHYSQVNEENKKFDDPEKHIQDKYFNKNSPYYVTGLTQRERQICAKAEQDVLHGIAPALNGYDPVIQENFGGCNIFMMDMEWNQEIRESMNDAINQEFEENGIVIPENADLQLMVDPYDFYIHASGVDEDLAKRIEEVLNKGKNGYYLYYHISYCNPVNYGVEEPSQFTQGDAGKMAIYHLVDKLTGYDIRELENKNGKFYTPDGEDLWEVLTEKYSELVADGGSSFGIGDYYADYKRIAKEGWNRSTDSNLTIGYKNGSLYDIGTSYGYGPGQTTWQDSVRDWYEKNFEVYQKERVGTIYREENTPSKLDLAIAATEQITAELDGNHKIVSDTENNVIQLIAPDKSEFQTILNRLLKDGLLVPLTDKVLSLWGEPKTILNFDRKA